jgi:hypothetical protein
VFVGSGYRAAAFEVEAAYPPGSPPPINGHHPPATPVNSSATTSPSRKFAGPTERRAPRTARPFGGGAPRRIRLGLTSFRRSTAVPTGPGQRPSLPVRQLQSRRLGPRDGRDRHRNGQHPHGRRFDRVIPTVGLVQVGQVRPKRSYMPWLGSVTKATRCPSRVDFANSLASRPQQPTV